MDSPDTKTFRINTIIALILLAFLKLVRDGSLVVLLFYTYSLFFTSSLGLQPYLSVAKIFLPIFFCAVMLYIYAVTRLYKAKTYSKQKSKLYCHILITELIANLCLVTSLTSTMFICLSINDFYQTTTGAIGIVLIFFLASWHIFETPYFIINLIIYYFIRKHERKISN